LAATGGRYNPAGDHPEGYISYFADGAAVRGLVLLADFAVTQAGHLPPFGAAMFHPAVNRGSATPNKQE
jgi:hypothetical protein